MAKSVSVDPTALEKRVRALEAGFGALSDTVDELVEAERGRRARVAEKMRAYRKRRREREGKA